MKASGPRSTSPPSVPSTAASASPPPMPLPTVIRSGTTPSCSLAHIRPVRPSPDWISSKSSSAPAGRQRLPQPGQEARRRDHDAAVALDRLEHDAAGRVAPRRGSTSRSSAEHVAERRRRARRSRPGREGTAPAAGTATALAVARFPASPPCRAPAEVAAREATTARPVADARDRIASSLAIAPVTARQHAVEPGRRDRGEALRRARRARGRERPRGSASASPACSRTASTTRVAVADGGDREAGVQVEIAAPVGVLDRARPTARSHTNGGSSRNVRMPPPSWPSPGGHVPGVGVAAHRGHDRASARPIKRAPGRRSR